MYKELYKLMLMIDDLLKTKQNEETTQTLIEALNMAFFEQVCVTGFRSNITRAVERLKNNKNQWYELKIKKIEDIADEINKITNKRRVPQSEADAAAYITHYENIIKEKGDCISR